MDTEEQTKLYKQISDLEKIEDLGTDLALAVWGLFDFISKSHDIDIEEHEGTLRKCYDDFAKAVKGRNK